MKKQPVRQEEAEDPGREEAAADPAAGVGSGAASVPLWRTLVKGLLLIAVLVAVGSLFKAVGLDQKMVTRWLDEEVVGQGLVGEALFVVVGAALVAVGLPRQLVGFGGGYAFGLFGGTVIALLAQICGCAIAFFYARLIGRRMVQQRFGARIARIDAFLKGNPFAMTLLIRFLPVGNNLVTNLAGGVSSVGAPAFIAGSAVGYVPQTVIFALIGTGVQVDPAVNITLGVALFLISGVLGVTLYRRARVRRAARRAV